MSTDINEAIARWMGWRHIHTSGVCSVGLPPGERDYRPIPGYHRSLDIQVPICDALDGYDIVLQRKPNNYWYADIRDSFGVLLAERSAYENPAEALATTIHAALVALGEVE